MKKVLLIIIAILFVPVLVNAETCDNEKVYIDSISIDKNNNVEEIGEASATGKNIELALGMSKVGDNIRYKIVVKNDSNEDYILDKNSINISSKYIDYTIESDNSNVVKAKSSKTIYLRVNYSHQVPASAYQNGLFNDEINMKVNLTTSNNLTNPNTGIKYILFISLVVLLMIGSLIIYKKKKTSKLMILIIGLSMFIPISVYAICRCDISINSTVAILEDSFSGTIYRTSYDNLPVDSFINGSYNWYIFERKTNQPESNAIETKQECEFLINRAISRGFINEGDYYCKLVIEEKTIEYALNPNELNNPFYIKDTVVNNRVTKAEVCFVTDKEVCLKDNFTESYNLLKNEEEWFNNNGGECTFYEGSEGVCGIDGIMEVALNNHNNFYVHQRDVLGCNANYCYFDGK